MSGPMSCVKVQVTVLGSLSLTVLDMVSVHVKRRLGKKTKKQQQQFKHSELRSCVKVEVAVLGSRPSLIVLTVSVNVKQHLKK